MARFLGRDCNESGRILLTGGGRLSSLVMTETGEVPAILDEARLTVVHNQAEAGARYFAHFPWTAEAGGDLGRL